MAENVDIYNTPAAPPPPGMTSNLVNPQDDWALLLATAIIALVVSVPLVLIRLFTKLRVNRALQYEDYVLCLAEIALVIWAVLMVLQPTHGAHIWDTSLYDLGRFAYSSNLLIILYVPSILLAKWAILLQLSRIFTIQPFTGTWWVVRAMIWTSSTFYAIIFFVDVFQCVPRTKIWDPSVPGQCFSVDGILISTSLFNVLMNCSILALPLFVLRGLQINARKKATVSAVFSVTALAALASMMRTAYSFVYMYGNDPTRTIFPVAMWAAAEIACIIVATTFPTMPLFLEYCRGGREAAIYKVRTAGRRPVDSVAVAGAGGARHFDPWGRFTGKRRTEPSCRPRDSAVAPWFTLDGFEHDGTAAIFETEIKAGSATVLSDAEAGIAGAELTKEGSTMQASDDDSIGLALSETSSRDNDHYQSWHGGGTITKTVEVEITSVV